MTQTRVLKRRQVSNVVENKRKSVVRYLERLQKKRKYQRKENTGKLSLKEFPIPVERETDYAAFAASVSEILGAYRQGKSDFGTGVSRNYPHNALTEAWHRGMCDAMRQSQRKLRR